MICTAHPILFGVTKPRRIRLVGHVARMGEKRGVYRVLVRKPDGDTGIGRRIILRWIFRKRDVGAWIGSSWLRVGRGGGHL